jgi:peptidoglycan/xylan/chitin deacetylase (PgdA/CDA1 family)
MKRGNINSSLSIAVIAALQCLMFLQCSGSQVQRRTPLASCQVLSALESPRIALTFDDGPSKSTPLILDILKRNGIKATFFVIGKNADRHPEIIQRIAEEGHILGVHTYSHSLWSSIKTPKQIALELDKTAHAIYRVTGQDPSFFRPPFGWDSPLMDQVCKKKGYTTIKWTIDPKDWQHPAPDMFVSRIVNRARDNAIVLLHDGLQTEESPNISSTIQALPILIDTLSRIGYRFVAVNEIRKKGGPSLQLPVPLALNR